MKNKMNILIFISLVLGIVGGLYIPEFMNGISFLGTIYINLLKFIIIPIIFTSVMITVYNSKNEKWKLIFKSLIMFVVLFTATYLLTAGVLYLINPTEGLDLSLINWEGEIISLNLSEILVNIFPSNIVTMISDNAIFACILFAIFCGIAAIKVEKGDKVIEIMTGFKNIFYKLLEYIMYLTPFGVFSLIGTTVANFGSGIIGVGAKYIGFAYLCCLIALVVIMILPVWIFAKISPIKYVKNIWKLWVMTSTTCSSVAALPYTINVCNDNFKTNSKTTNIVLPLGCSVHKSGGAVSFALLGIFCSLAGGVNITTGVLLYMLVTALLINMSAPGIPSGGIVLGATYLSMLGLPLVFIGVYSGIYRLLDMAYTTLNVTGNVTADILLDSFSKKKKSN